MLPKPIWLFWHCHWHQYQEVYIDIAIKIGVCACVYLGSMEVDEDIYMEIVAPFIEDFVQWYSNSRVYAHDCITKVDNDYTEMTEMKIPWHW